MADRGVLVHGKNYSGISTSSRKEKEIFTTRRGKMKSYLIKLPDGTQMGPFPWEKIDKLYASRRISGDDLVWTEGMPAWLPLREVQKKEGRTAFATGGYIRRFQTGEGGSVLFSFSGRRKPQGPYTFKEISNWYATGQLSPEAFLWKEGMAEWVRVGDLSAAIRRKAPSGWGFWNAIISDRPFSHRKIQFEKAYSKGYSAAGRRRKG